MTMFAPSDDDRFWLDDLEASDLVHLLHRPHEFVREVFDKTLNDAFTIIYRDVAEGKSSMTGAFFASDYLVSGIDGTGLIFIEGKPSDTPLEGARLPRDTKGFDTGFARFEGQMIGGIHGDTGKDTLEAAKVLVLAIRHRTALAQVLSRQLWTFKLFDGNDVIDRRQGVSYTFTFAEDPVIFYHGTKSTMTDSCHAGQTRIIGGSTPDDRTVTGPFQSVLSSYGVKSPNPKPVNP